eukprot:TRINITY_DN7692_c0_g1_i2.p1 TRINITY_DN7692_c0_g1~~TRINITY_DN7692_c0_g1_i2.p1  ORF type:complete len:283 (-),score=51.62 TRINITY_DN7692_c0_g1_i2:830-1678(-)
MATVDRGQANQAFRNENKGSFGDRGVRKTLGDITNKVSSGLHPLSSQKTPLNKAKTPAAPRLALRNITNEAPPPKSSVKDKKPTTATPSSQKPFLKNRFAASQVDSAKALSLKPQARLEVRLKDVPALTAPVTLQRPAKSAAAELKKKAEMYAQDGIEHMHFGSREQEALREAQLEQEVQEMVKVAVNFRTDWPSVLLPSESQSDGEEDVQLQSMPPSPFSRMAASGRTQQPSSPGALSDGDDFWSLDLPHFAPTVADWDVESPTVDHGSLDDKSDDGTAVA